MPRRRMTIVLAAASLVLAACGPSTGSPAASSEAPSSAEPSAAPSASSAPATGGTVRIGMKGYPDSLNPGNGVLTEAYTMYELVYDTPLAVTAAGEYVGELATDWSVSDDGLTWTLKIRDDAVFHDGTPLTAEDVAFTMQLYKDTEDFPFLPSYVASFETIEATDATTVTLTTAEPFAAFEPAMVFIYVLPKHIWEKVDDPVAFTNEEMIGSGPFKLKEASQGEFVDLAANKDYWKTPPNVDEVIFQVIENDDARVTALTDGQVDAITDVPETAIPSLQNTENVTVHIADVAAGGSLSDIFFNVVSDEDCPADDGSGQPAKCSGHPALKDLAVRQALAHATDKEQLVTVGTGGLGTPGLSLVPPGLGAFFASEIKDYDFDVDKANSMLDAAGYADTDGDGIRECLATQDCDDLTLRLNYPNDATSGPRESDLIKSMWADVGVNVVIQALDPDTLTSVCCPTFDYDVIMWGWGSDPDPAFLLGVALCSEIDTGFSESGYCNPKYDELYDAQAVATDVDERVDIIHRMQQILMDDVPYIIPYYYPYIGAWRTDSFVGWLENDPTLGLEDSSNLIGLRPAG